MKKILLFISFFIIWYNSIGQSVGISDDNTFTPTSLLHINAKSTFTENIFTCGKDASIFFNVINNGNIGVGISTPTEKLHVNGNLLLTGAFMPNNISGNSGQVLKSNGASAPPSWVGAITTSDIYSVESTARITLTTSWQIITGESITINGLLMGDRILIQYSGNAQILTADLVNVDMAAFVNGVMIAIGGYSRFTLFQDSRVPWQSFASSARYTIPSDGNYTFDIRAIKDTASGVVYVGGNSTSALEGVLIIYVLRN